MLLSRSKAISTFFLLIILFFLLRFIHVHGFISYDDGWFLQDGLRLLQGEKIYKDFHYLYNPGSLYINALAFKLFGVSIFASRIFAFMNSCLAVIFLMLISKKIKLHYLLSTLLICSYIFWGPAHVNFVWPVMFCITFALGIGTLFLYDTKEKRVSYLIMIGILSACIFILKQNFGLAIFIVIAVVLFYKTEYRNIRSIALYSVGYLFIILLQIWYFLWTNSLNSYIQEFYEYTFIKIYQQGILNSGLPWDYPGPIFIKVVKFLLYLSPLLICSFSAIKLWKEKKESALIYFPLVGIGFYLFSIRPTTDYIHLTPLISLSLIPLILIYNQIKQLKYKVLLILLFTSVCMAGIYSSFFRNYYRWNTPLIKQKTFVSLPTAKIWTDSKEKESITQITEYYETHAKSEEYTFIYYFTPIYYLLLDKKNPTMYDDLQLGGVSNKDQKIIVNILKEKNVKHIITDTDISQEKSIIALFIKQNYKGVKKVNEYTIWKRN